LFQSLSGVQAVGNGCATSSHIRIFSLFQSLSGVQAVGNLVLVSHIRVLDIVSIPFRGSGGWKPAYSITLQWHRDCFNPFQGFRRLETGTSNVFLDGDF